MHVKIRPDSRGTVGSRVDVSIGVPQVGCSEWRCKECGRLLGVEEGEQMHIRVKKRADYLVGYPVTAVCPSCNTLNVRRSQ